MNERGLRSAFPPALAALILTLLAAAFMAYYTEYTYSQRVGFETYTSLGKGLAAVLGAAILGMAVVTHSIRLRREQLESRLMRWLEAQGGFILGEWGDDVEQALLDKEVEISADEETTEEVGVGEALEERSGLLRMRKYATRLFGVPVAAFIALAGISLWAIPASVAFLRVSYPLLGTTLIWFASYGTGAALAILVAVIMKTARV